MNEPKRELCKLIDQAVESVLGPTEGARMVGYAVTRLFDDVEDEWEEIRWLEDTKVGDWKTLNHRYLAIRVHRETVPIDAELKPDRTAGMGG